MKTRTYSEAAAQDRLNAFGSFAAGQLQPSLAALPHDVSERLRAARERAVAQRTRQFAWAPEVAAARQTQNNGQGTASLSGPDGMGWLGAVVSFGAVLALLIGLVFVQQDIADSRVIELAALDTELLADELPPQAYADPGFAEYIKARR